jgi:hypothetical protein
MIPPENSAAVTRALRDAFGVTEFADIRELTWGPNANLAFRIVVRGSAFLLRINTRKGDLPRHYGCMKAASEAGLAPRVWYTSVEDRISITDFVETLSFPKADALVRIPRVLRTLHALAPFPDAPHHLNTTCMFLMHKGPAVEGFFEKFRAAHVLSPQQSEELFAGYEQVLAVYPHHEADMVSSHNDLFKPDNMLYDGQRLWLVDWEAAFRNDRYADLAVVANQVAVSDAEEQQLLQEYFGEPPDEYKRARFFLMQQVAHMFYAMAFLWQAAAAKPIDWSEPVPEYSDFHQRFWAGAIKLTDIHTKTVYGRVHWERLLQNMGQARFQEALRIVAGRHATA